MGVIPLPTAASSCKLSLRSDCKRFANNLAAATLPAYGALMPTLSSLHHAEAQLRAAMLAGDITALDALLADDLLFVSPARQGVGKSEDLALHRSGRLRLHRLDTRILSSVAGPSTAVTELEAVIGGTFDGTPFEGAYLYTRMWRLEEGRWRVTAALCKDHLGTP